MTTRPRSSPALYVLAGAIGAVGLACISSVGSGSSERRFTVQATSFDHGAYLLDRDSGNVWWLSAGNAPDFIGAPVAKSSEVPVEEAAEAK